MNITYDVFLDDHGNVAKAQKNLIADGSMIKVKDFVEEKLVHIKGEVEAEDKTSKESNIVLCIEGLNNNMGYYCKGYSKELSEKIMNIFDEMERRHLSNLLFDARAAWRAI